MARNAVERKPMVLPELVHGLTDATVPPVAVGGIASHSQQVRPGDLFIAVRGPQQDGHQFLDDLWSDLAGGATQKGRDVIFCRF